MTTFVITVGYNPNFNKKEVWEELVEYVNYLRDKPELILLELAPFLNEDDGKMYEECAALYSKNSKDLTIKIQKIEDIESGAIIQSSSGGGGWRDIKEDVRRAFCSLVLKHMNRKRMNININVC